MIGLISSNWQALYTLHDEQKLGKAISEIT